MQDLETPTMQIREQLRADDVMAVSKLVRSTGLFNDEELGIAIELVDERLEKGEASGYDFLFAQTDETTLGYACYGRTPGTRFSWDLYWIVVDREVQGVGIGSRLLREVEARVRAAGGRQIWVDTSGREQNEPTLIFYLHNGYRHAARLEDFYAPDDDKLILVKPLDQRT